MMEDYVSEGFVSEFEKAYMRYQEAFGEEYPYVYLNLTLEAAIKDMGRRIRSRIPVPEEEYAEILQSPTPEVDARRRMLKKARLLSEEIA